MSTINVGTVNIFDRLRLPLYTTAQRDALVLETGLLIYNTSLNVIQVYNGLQWTEIKSILDGSTEELAATSATSLKETLISTSGSATNGAYWYKFNDGTTRRLWTDFTTYAPYNFVMVTRIWNGSQNQYLTTEENVTQLATIPNNSAPTAHAKLSDALMNEIIVPNSIRWVIVGNGSTFYRLDDNPQWYSNHGAAQSCSYDRGFYSGIATPSSSPSWTTSGFTYQACGGIYLSSGVWGSLSGIHTNDGVYFGGYSGGWGGRATPPSPYGGLGGSSNQWSQNGYVLLNW